MRPRHDLPPAPRRVFALALALALVAGAGACSDGSDEPGGPTTTVAGDTSSTTTAGGQGTTTLEPTTTSSPDGSGSTTTTAPPTPLESLLLTPEDYGEDYIIDSTAEQAPPSELCPGVEFPAEFDDIASRSVVGPDSEGQAQAITQQILRFANPTVAAGFFDDFPDAAEQCTSGSAGANLDLEFSDVPDVGDDAVLGTATGQGVTVLFHLVRVGRDAVVFVNFAGGEPRMSTELLQAAVARVRAG